MKYVILHILCEGQTEERFVKEILAPYLQQFNIFAKAVVLLTSKKKNMRGGMLNYEQAKRDLTILFKQYRDNSSERHIFTTMFDYYALPEDFPSASEAAKIQDVRERINCIEQAFSADIANNAFIPYIQLHEFEALLFVDITKLIYDYPLCEESIHKLKNETDAFGDPELINNSPETAPSKRIIKALEDKYNYNKKLSGTNVTSKIGIETLRKNCRHFNDWIAAIVASQ
jgi:hypothetical protein